MHPDLAVTPLDEQALRTPRFRHGYPTVLADGQTWHVPKPHPIWVITEEEPGYEIIWDFDKEHLALLASLVEANDAEDTLGIVAGEMRLYAHILRKNYNLDAAAIRQLIRLDFGDDPSPESVAMHRVFRAAATGTPPPADDPEPATAEPAPTTELAAEVA